MGIKNLPLANITHQIKIPEIWSAKAQLAQAGSYKLPTLKASWGEEITETGASVHLTWLKQVFTFAVPYHQIPQKQGISYFALAHLESQSSTCTLIG